MAYSVTCAALRTASCTWRTARSLKSGKTHRRTGPRNREVRVLDIKSVDAPKIRAMTSTTGSQETRKDFERDTGGWNQLAGEQSNPFVIRFANDPAVWQSGACL